ncbi:MAG: rhodanese-related sulfurtransferase [Cyclobacteriaceae bacterium]|nr:MAG: rhodanese-related sulfurtransferase [Cyclobacteriaceae bacterium]
MDYSILLYYCYTRIDNPEKFREEHHFFCLELDLRGRIIVASEGINGTVSGLKSNCEKYMLHMRSDPAFAHIEFKVESWKSHTFQKLNVRVKSEIVNVGLPHIDPKKNTGQYLEPDEFLQMKDQKDTVVLDVRSNYEHKLGKFKGAQTLDIENFREFPEKLAELQHLKNKKVITYCTGGIKCEKATAFLLENGFDNVYQLHGGIIKHGLEAGGEDFEGKCYVFDNRVAVDVNSVNPVVISKCYICTTDCDRMVNCANPTCNLHVPICPDCANSYQGACSRECLEHPDKRPFNGSGYYQKSLNGYNPYRGIRRDRGDKTRLQE